MESMAGWNGSSWLNRDQSSISAGSTGNLTSSVVNLFGPFTFGSKSPLTNPLPIEYVDYNAQYSAGQVIVTWSTATETNNAYFTIEKSTDINVISSVGTIEGVGNSNIVLNYRFVDTDPGTGIIYYRIRQTDYDGQTEVSEWMEVNVPSGDNINIVSDNSSGNIIITFDNINEEYQIRVYNLTGNCLAKATNIMGGENNVVIHLQNFSTGIYIVNISTNNTVISKKILL